MAQIPTIGRTPTFNLPLGEALQTMYGFANAQTLQDLRSVFPLIERVYADYGLSESPHGRPLIARPLSDFLDPKIRRNAVQFIQLNFEWEIAAFMQGARGLSNSAWRSAFISAGLPISADTCDAYYAAGVLRRGDSRALMAAASRFRQLESARSRSILGALKAAALSL